jgi:hypothetical protein
VQHGVADEVLDVTPQNAIPSATPATCFFPPAQLRTIRNKETHDKAYHSRVAKRVCLIALGGQDVPTTALIQRLDVGNVE